MWSDFKRRRVRRSADGSAWLMVDNKYRDSSVLLETEKAKRTLATFAETVHFLDGRFRDAGLISETSLPVLEFGFFGSQDLRDVGFARPSPNGDGALFFLNYMRISSESKAADDVVVFAGSKMTSPRWKWSYWTWRVMSRIVDATIEACASLRFERKDFDAYLDCLSSLRSVSSFYDCELKLIRSMLESPLTDAVRADLEKRWGIPMKHRRKDWKTTK